MGTWFAWAFATDGFGDGEDVGDADDCGPNTLLKEAARFFGGTVLAVARVALADVVVWNVDCCGAAGMATIMGACWAAGKDPIGQLH